MTTVDITTEQFEATISKDGIVLLDFWAEWCGPCKAFAPVYESVSEANEDITFAKVDTESEQQLSGALGIQSIPTLMIFRDGIQLFSQPGALPEPTLTDLISQVRELDMDSIRAEIAEQQAAAGQSDEAEAAEVAEDEEE